MAPFLDVPVLRKIVQTLTNDPRGDFDQWAKNPLILKMLSEAKKALEEKRFTEEEAEHLILQYIKACCFSPAPPSRRHLRPGLK